MLYFNFFYSKKGMHFFIKLYVMACRKQKYLKFTLKTNPDTEKDSNYSYILSKSESVKFSLIESVIFLFTNSSVETIFFTVKSVNFHCLISENNIFHC